MTTYLNVLFKDKTEAKARGARWDGEAKKWFVPFGLKLEPFTSWLSVDPLKLASQELTETGKGVPLSQLLAGVATAVAPAGGRPRHRVLSRGACAVFDLRSPERRLKRLFDSVDPIVVRGRLWRATNPSLPEQERQRLTAQLIDARRQLRGKAPDDVRAAARAAVDAAKVGLGVRGPIWWPDGEPDLNRRLVHDTSYATWYAILQEFA